MHENSSNTFAHCSINMNLQKITVVIFIWQIIAETGLCEYKKMFPNLLAQTKFMKVDSEISV